ncbi:hypothetical protein HUU51_00625 [Candidatus Gracilibacteria bacterium]|nr:hypothetical protein [Candidatus Gracilibacteria bacterium]
MRKIFIITIIFILNIIFFTNVTHSNQTIPSANNVQIGNNAGGNSLTNKYLNDLGGNGDINAGSDGEKSIYNLLFTIAKDLKTIFYIIAGLYFLILVIRLLFSENTEEAATNFKKGVLWITLGILLMQISFYVINTLYAKDVGGTLANNLTKNLINPVIRILETAASFFFILIAIFAFYTIITANGDEEKVKKGKMTIVYGLLGFIIIKLAKEIVYASYGRIDCSERTILGIFQINGNNCATVNQISGISDIIIKVINWLNGFVGIAVILMIIYAGVQVLFSAGDEEKLAKAKKAIIYIIIGIAILILNYFILSFLIKPEIVI